MHNIKSSPAKSSTWYNVPVISFANSPWTRHFKEPAHPALSNTDLAWPPNWSNSLIPLALHSHNKGMLNKAISIDLYLCCMKSRESGKRGGEIWNWGEKCTWTRSGHFIINSWSHVITVPFYLFSSILGFTHSLTIFTKHAWLPSHSERKYSTRKGGQAVSKDPCRCVCVHSVGWKGDNIGHQWAISLLLGLFFFLVCDWNISLYQCLGVELKNVSSTNSFSI